MKKELLYKLNKLKIFCNQHPVISEVVFWIFFIFSAMVKCFYFQFTTQVNMRPFLSLVNCNMMMSSFAVLIIFVAITLVFFNKRRFEALFAFNIVLTILFLADTNFYRYYYNAITIPVFYQFNLGVIGSVNQSILSLFKFKDIIYVIDLPIMIWMLILIKKIEIPKLKLSNKIAYIVVLSVTGLTIFFSSYSKSNAELFPYDNNYVVRSLGILFFHCYDAKEFIESNVLSSKDLLPDEKSQVEDFYKNNKKVESSNYNGIAKGKNLIVVQMEAMQQFVINKTIEGKEITPNLNKLIKESLYFDNIYYQVAGGNTSDAEFLCNVSLYPIKEGAVYHRYPANTYYTLPKSLSALGYNTYVMHAFAPEFWNRAEMYKAIGFDKFFNVNDYVLDDFAGWDGTALSDDSFFRQSLDKIDYSKPFYSFMITLSSHHPFSYFENYDFDVGEFEGTYMGNFLKGAHYADSCLGNFINDLKKRGLFENTLLVLYGDHSAVPKIEAKGLFDFLKIEYSEYEWIKLQKVPLIIHYPQLKNGETVHSVGGEIDILPTIANLMGFNAPYALGKDLLNTSEGYVVLRNGSVITDKFIYLNNLNEVFDAQTGDTLVFDEYKDKIESLINQLKISDIIIEKNAFSISENK